MKFIVDNQLPALLANHLRQWGHDCNHVMDVGLGEADDAVVWEWAIKEGRIVISKDEDFVYLATRPGDTGKLVWVRLGNCRNTALTTAFDRVRSELIAAFEAGRRVVEVR